MYNPTLHSQTHCQVAQANTQAKTLQRVCLPNRTTDRQKDEENEALGGNRRLAQWRVTWIIEHSTSHQILWCIDSFVLRNPPLCLTPIHYYPFKMLIKLIILLTLTLFFLGCETNTPVISGLYVADNSDIFYALRINDSEDSIELFIIKEYSTSDSPERIESRKDFSHSKKGSIKYEKGTIQILELESDILPGKRSKMPTYKVDENRIIVNCEELKRYIRFKSTNRMRFGRTDFQEIKIPPTLAN
ncbi:MAG: hypothetical protein ACYC1Q_08435 [Bacteroidia bacterium]